MPSVKITAKRQATLPLETCKALRIGPGDIVDVEARVIDNEEVWILRPRKSPDRSWIGSLGKEIHSSNHSMESIRESIAKGWAQESK
jgi:bifunctional DNA-binding transcriptional regulator/antitoxin component of YhaV-PrlF toxin-antitoxin module